MQNGLFIVLEGIDGTGKTTQAKMLQEYLQKKGIRTLLLHEPGTTPAGLKIRELVLDKDIPMDNMTQAMLFLAARASLVNTVIRPELEQGTIIICDRFTASTLAYQGYAADKDEKYISNLEKINNIILQGIAPNIVFYLKGDPRQLKSRRDDRGVTDRYESKAINFQYKLSEAYDKILMQEATTIQIDALQAPQAIANQIQEFTEAALQHKIDWYKMKTYPGTSVYFINKEIEIAISRDSNGHNIDFYQYSDNPSDDDYIDTITHDNKNCVMEPYNNSQMLLDDCHIELKEGKMLVLNIDKTFILSIVKADKKYVIRSFDETGQENVIFINTNILDKRKE